MPQIQTNDTATNAYCNVRARIGAAYLLISVALGFTSSILTKILNLKVYSLPHLTVSFGAVIAMQILVMLSAYQFYKIFKIEQRQPAKIMLGLALTAGTITIIRTVCGIIYIYAWSASYSSGPHVFLSVFGGMAGFITQAFASLGRSLVSSIVLDILLNSWTILLGLILLRENIIPRYIGVLLIIGGSGPIIAYITHFAFTNGSSVVYIFITAIKVMPFILLLLRGLQGQELRVDKNEGDIQTASINT